MVRPFCRRDVSSTVDVPAMSFPISSLLEILFILACSPPPPPPPLSADPALPKFILSLPNGLGRLGWMSLSLLVPFSVR